MKKTVLILLSLILTLLLIASCGTGEDKEEDTTADIGTESGDITTPATTAPIIEQEIPKEELMPNCAIVGEFRISFISDRIVRIEKKTENGFEDRPSLNVTGRLFSSTVDYTKEEIGEEVRFKTAGYTVCLPKDADAFSQNIYVLSCEGEELWRFTSHTGSSVYLPSPSSKLKSFYFSDSPRVIPSSQGYSLSDAEYEKNNGWEIDEKAEDVYVFLPNGSYENFTSDFIKITGRSEMVTLGFLGYWDSRYFEYTQETAIKQVDDYLSRGYPIDNLVIDTDWRKSAGTDGIGYSVNIKLIPNIKKLMSDLHKKGVSVMFNDHPEPVKNTTSLLDRAEIKYRYANLRNILSSGLDYWWYDRNWHAALNPVADGVSIYATGMYAFYDITKGYYEEQAEKTEEYSKRPLIMGNVDGINNGDFANPSTLFAHRYSIQWTGDVGSFASDLRQEVENAVKGGVIMGLPYISSDIGGHQHATTDEMYIRWFQYGSFSTIMRVHCRKPFSRMPWLYGEKAESVAHEYIDMRYRLLPLYYNLAHENYETGLPIMRRLDINYPELKGADRNDQYLLGDHLLVAPVTGEHTAKSIAELDIKNGSNEGFKVEYFANNSLSGEPAAVGTVKDINFDWKTGGPEELNGRVDDFSIRYTAEITAKDKDIYLQAYADDGIRIYIDGEKVLDGWTVYDTYLLTKKPIKAGTTSKVVIEFFEGGYDAHIYIKYMDEDPYEDTRDVFLPSGSWIDVWTGKVYEGNSTVTVTHGLETSPLFVRQGAIIPLAENMSNVSEKSWESMALDIYPSRTDSAETVIYEDDGETVAYKEGKFRTTDISLKYDGNSDAAVINIEAAKGSFEHSLRGFTERNFTIRIHNGDMGKVKKVTVNGSEVSFTEHTKTEEASPFAFSGPALDSDITELIFKTNIYSANEVVVYFE